jgi:predicted nucleotidyltransferase
MGPPAVDRGFNRRVCAAPKPLARVLDGRAYVSWKECMSLIRDMRFREALNPVLGSPSKLRLLRTLYVEPARTWTGRELAQAARVSTAQAARDLRELADTSLVSRDVVGRAYSWRLSSTNILVPVLASLFRQESNLRSELLQTVSGALDTKTIERAKIFGSVSRGEERDDSDVDLFVQVRSARDREEVEMTLDKVRSRVWDRFGNPVSALVYTRSEADHAPNPALLDTIDHEGLDVAGEG